jgi:hypothetical protein
MNREKKPIKILKNQPVWFDFGFISLKPKKPNRNRKKPKPNWKKTEPKQSQTEKIEPNRFKPVFVLKNRTEPNRNRSVWTGFDLIFFLISVWLSFFNKNWIE